MRECLEEGMIQAYVDGELSPETSSEVMMHAGACATCATAISEAENELSLLAAAFEPELSLPVPSERLRERLDTAIVELRAQASAPAKTSSRSLKGWLASLVPSFNFAPGQAVGFASLVAVVAFTAIIAAVALRHDNRQALVAVVGGNQGFRPPMLVELEGSNGGTTPTKDDRNNVTTPARYRRPRAATPAAGPKVEGAETVAKLEKPLPGEISYLKTIASLSSIIEKNGDNALKPSLRSNYERNLALVDHAIDSTRRTARRNPKDPDAAEVLYSSYQSKVDLLSTVAEQGQMVAIAR